MPAYFVWIDHEGQHGGDTIVDATDAGDALRQGLAWAASGVWEAGDKYDVNVQREDARQGNRLEPEVGTTITVEGTR